MRIYRNLFDKIISLENLMLSWEKFRRGKTGKPDVQKFEFNLEENIFNLHRDLKNKTYIHGEYDGFYITDPKTRHIHKATVKDRVLHHAIFRILNPVFEETFISNSFSCRVNKGSHLGVEKLASMIRSESKNYTSPCFVLKCDVKKFFDSVDHHILLKIIKRRTCNNSTSWLVGQVIKSYSAKQTDLFNRQGIPIGNLTSQLFANIYLNELDQYIKNKLKVKYYARYTDDFVIVSKNKKYLRGLLDPLKEMLFEKLKLELHPQKVSIENINSGIDFLGYVIFPHHTLIRQKTKRRMFKKLKRAVKQYKQKEISQETLEQSLQSYLGVLSHANAYKLSQDLKNMYWFWLNE